MGIILGIWGVQLSHCTLHLGAQGHSRTISWNWGQQGLGLDYNLVLLDDPG